MTIDSARLHRHVPLDALRNVREVGGYTGRAGQVVRWHRLYRADDLSRAGGRDLDALAQLGVRTVVDLRSPAEVVARPAAILPGEVEHRHLPLVRDRWRPRPVEPRSGLGDAPPVDLLVEQYLSMMVEGAPALADALAILASPASYPVLVHSTLGKDRAGVLIAVVLGLLAVHDEEIVEDYAESEHRLGDVAVLSALAVSDPRRSAVAGAGSPPEAMAALLARIRRRTRSMVGFARSIGVTFETVEALHDNLLS